MVLGIYDNWADVIFNKLYKVRVPLLSTYSEEELDIVGIPFNVIDGDNHDAHELTTIVMIPIVSMVEKYNNGFSVAVVEPRDMDQIYDVITNHLLAWRNHRATSLNQTALPAEDLVLLDKFAQEIFGNNKKTIIKTNVIATKAFGGNFSDLLMRNNKRIQPEIDYDKVERESMAPKIKREAKYDLNSLLMH